MAIPQRKVVEQDFGRLMAMARGFQSAQTFLTANRLDIFSVLFAKKGPSAPEVARALKVNQRAMRMLLDALAALGLVVKKNGRYYNAPVAQAFLVKGKESYRGAIFHHLHHTWEAWSHLAEVIKKGGPPAAAPQESRKEDKIRTRDFILGMYSIARGVAPQVAKLLDLSKVKKMLDLGGGPGTYAIVLAQKNPQIKAVVFDLPPVIPIAGEIIRRHGMEKKVKTMAGDYHKNDYGKDYDLILMSHILHSNGEKPCRALIRRAYRALAPGGQIVIHEFAVDESRTRPPMAAFFALHMLVNTERGGTYTPSEMAGWLKAAGCRRTRVKKVPGDTTLVIGWK